MNQNNIDISNNIRLIMNERNLTIRELSEKSNVPQSTIKNILYGQSKNIRINTIIKLCSCFDIELSDFFSHND